MGGSVMNGGRSFIASPECQNISMCNVNPTEGKTTSGGHREDLLTFHGNPRGQRPFLTFTNSRRRLHQQPVVTDPTVSSITLKVDQVCNRVNAYLMHALRLCAFFLFFLRLGGTDVLFIDLQDVKRGLCECVTVEQRQAMLSVSGL